MLHCSCGCAGVPGVIFFPLISSKVPRRCRIPLRDFTSLIARQQLQTLIIFPARHVPLKHTHSSRVCRSAVHARNHTAYPSTDFIFPLYCDGNHDVLYCKVDQTQPSRQTKNTASSCSFPPVTAEISYSSVSVPV